jgi:hypothetical protein
MLKNQSNAQKHKQWKFVAVFGDIFATGIETRDLARRTNNVVDFIENCPLKIKRIKIEGFV